MMEAPPPPPLSAAAAVPQTVTSAGTTAQPQHVLGAAEVPGQHRDISASSTTDVLFSRSLPKPTAKTRVLSDSKVKYWAV